MTREEEIQNYAYNNCMNDDMNDTSYSLIVETARWADETMIDNACKWLEENTHPVFYNGNDWTTEEFIDNFKKAMELCI